MEWKEGKLIQAKLFSALGGICTVASAQPIKVVEKVQLPAK
jgi:hypothetical protein